MKLSEIVTEIQTRSGDSNITEATITGWVNTALRQIANRSDWSWLLKTDETDTTIAGTQEYTLPTDFKKMYSLRVGDAASTETNAEDYFFVGYGDKNLAIKYDIDECYYINPTNDYYGLVPNPAVTGNKVYQKYYAYPTTISCVSATPDMPTQYHDMLVDFGLARYFEQEDEGDKLVLYETKVENAIEQMKTEHLKSRAQRTRMTDLREHYVNTGLQDISSLIKWE